MTALLSVRQMLNGLAEDRNFFKQYIAEAGEKNEVFHE